MHLINKESDYAIRAVLYLSETKHKKVSSKEISNQQKIPLIYVRRILGTLKENDVVQSKEGKYGGFKLKKSSSNINMLDVIEIFQGKLTIIKCLYKSKKCLWRKKCFIRKKILKIEKKVANELRRISFENLSQDKSRTLK